MRPIIKRSIENFSEGLDPKNWALELELSEKYIELHNSNLFYFMTKQALVILPDLYPRELVADARHEKVLSRPSNATHLE